jgi:hypothetical protein
MFTHAFAEMIFSDIPAYDIKTKLN